MYLVPNLDGGMNCVCYSEFTASSVAGENDRIQGVGHGNQINGMKTIGDSLYTCGIDDSVKHVDLASNSYTSADIKLGSQPRGMDAKDDTIITASIKEVGTEAKILPSDVIQCSFSQDGWHCNKISFYLPRSTFFHLYPFFPCFYLYTPLCLVSYLSAWSSQ